MLTKPKCYGINETMLNCERGNVPSTSGGAMWQGEGAMPRSGQNEIFVGELSKSEM